MDAGTTPIRIETPRLVLEEFTLPDAAFIVELLNQPSFIEFIGDRGVRTTTDAERYLREGPMSSYRQHGHGLLKVRLRETATTLGMCGLVRRDTLPHADIGFALMPQFWNAGYVTEAARAAIDDGRTRLGLTTVLGITSPHNVRSIHVLGKLGLQFVEERSLAAGASPVRIFALATP
ncbi:MAG: GNAT family N-acetyltransferase [Nevskiaceae bacterium]